MSFISFFLEMFKCSFRSNLQKYKNRHYTIVADFINTIYYACMNEYFLNKTFGYIEAVLKYNE